MEGKQPRGRPPLSSAAMGKVRGVRFTEDEDRAVQDAAERAGMPVARWIRETAVDAARRDLSR